LPDKQAFWMDQSGKAFVGMHSATDTFRGISLWTLHVEMIGGEFRHHDSQAKSIALIRIHAPGTKMLPPVWHVKDEILPPQ